MMTAWIDQTIGATPADRAKLSDAGRYLTEHEGISSFKLSLKMYDDGDGICFFIFCSKFNCLRITERNEQIYV